MNKRALEEIRALAASMPPLPISISKTKYGIPYKWEEKSPGVYYVQSYFDDSRPYFKDTFRFAGKEYFVLAEDYSGGVISQKALESGDKYQGNYYFEVLKGGYVIRYELLRHEAEHATGERLQYLEKSMKHQAHFGAGECPEYFGAWQAPRDTPWGPVDKVKQVNKGVWFVKVQDTWYLSTIRAFFAHMDNLAIKLCHGDGDQHRFWELEDCAPAVYDLNRNGNCMEIVGYVTGWRDVLRCLRFKYPDFVEAERSEFIMLVKQQYRSVGGNAPAPALSDPEWDWIEEAEPWSGCIIDVDLLDD